MHTEAYMLGCVHCRAMREGGADGMVNRDAIVSEYEAAAAERYHSNPVLSQYAVPIMAPRPAPPPQAGKPGEGHGA